MKKFIASALALISVIALATACSFGGSESSAGTTTAGTLAPSDSSSVQQSSVSDSSGASVSSETDSSSTSDSSSTPELPKAALTTMKNWSAMNTDRKYEIMETVYNYLEDTGTAVNLDVIDLVSYLDKSGVDSKKKTVYDMVLKAIENNGEI